MQTTQFNDYEMKLLQTETETETETELKWTRKYYRNWHLNDADLLYLFIYSKWNSYTR